MKYNLYKIIAGVLLLVIVYLLSLMVKMNTEHKQLVNTLSQYEIANKTFQLQRQKDSSTIATQSQTILSEREAYKLGLIEIDKRLAKVESQMQAKMNTIIKEKDVPFIPNGYVDTTGKHLVDTSGWVHDANGNVVRTDSISVPQRFKLKEQWFNIDGMVKKDGLHIDSMSLPNKITVTFGKQKTGFLKLGRKDVVTLKNTNPYIQVIDMNNVVIKKKKGLFQSPLFYLGLGAIGGVLLTK